MRWQSHHPLYEDCQAMTGGLHQQLPPLHALPVAWSLQHAVLPAGPARHMPGPGEHAGKSQVTGLMRRLVWGVQTIVNGNVSQAEDMVADMAESATFRTRLQQAGLGVVHVLLVSCEPLDPEELPVRLRPPRYNVSLPVQGGECLAVAPALGKARRTSEGLL